MTMDVACLGHTWRQSMADNPAGPDDFRMPFLVEGSIYPAGTVGDGFVPSDDGSIGRWFCQGWLLVHADRAEPHVSSRQVYVFGAITEEQQFPTDMKGANTTVLDDGTGDLAPNFTFEVDYFVPEL